MLRGFFLYDDQNCFIICKYSNHNVTVRVAIFIYKYALLVEKIRPPKGLNVSNLSSEFLHSLAVLLLPGYEQQNMALPRLTSFYFGKYE